MGIRLCAHGVKVIDNCGRKLPCSACDQTESNMTATGKLFRADALARTYDPTTSHEAALLMSEDRLDGLHKLIMDTCRRHPEGLTILEVKEITGEDMQTISPRFAYLYRNGFLKRVGKKLNASTNRPAFIHIVA